MNLKPIVLGLGKPQPTHDYPGSALFHWRCRTLFDGFMDCTPSAIDRATENNVTPQIKWDLDKALGMRSSRYLSMKYVYWKNKFAIDGVTENHPNLLLKWHF